MKKKIAAISFAASLLIVPSAWAQDHSQAKTKTSTATSPAPNDDVARTRASEVPRTATRTVASKTTMAWRVSNDINRLQAILVAMNTTANLSDGALRSSANEANMLANRIHARIRSAVRGRDARATGVSAASDLRTHVRMMRSEALEGDRAGARQHAAEALPFANRLEDLLERPRTNA